MSNVVTRRHDWVGYTCPLQRRSWSFMAGMQLQCQYHFQRHRNETFWNSN